MCSLNVGAVCDVQMVADFFALTRGVGIVKSHSNSPFEGPPYGTTMDLVEYMIPQ